MCNNPSLLRYNQGSPEIEGAMPATEFPVHPAGAERTRRILSACQCAATSGDYVRHLITALATEMQSDFAIWLNWPPAQGEPIAHTEGCETVLGRLRSLCDRAPILSNHLDWSFGVASIVAVPIVFRHSTAGVLAVANGTVDYTPADLDVLAATGRAALAAYENLKQAEALGMRSAAASLADLVHEVRQPLSIMEVCTYYLDLVLPVAETKARQQLTEMQSQLDAASRILDEHTGGYVRRGSRFAECAAEPGTPEPEEASRVLTNSAMSMVT